MSQDFYAVQLDVTDWDAIARCITIAAELAAHGRTLEFRRSEVPYLRALREEVRPPARDPRTVQQAIDARRSRLEP